MITFIENDEECKQKYSEGKQTHCYLGPGRGTRMDHPGAREDFWVMAMIILLNVLMALTGLVMCQNLPNCTLKNICSLFQISY
jgi:hypothetical protein